jgi:alpha-D-ribose 1-methylphosphonate 5-triphosphate synthase subunit PhnI
VDFQAELKQVRQMQAEYFQRNEEGAVSVEPTFDGEAAQ